MKNLEKFISLERENRNKQRTSDEGHNYFFSEDEILPFNYLNLPPISESSMNKYTHPLNFNDKNRLLTPIEAGRFPYNYG